MAASAGRVALVTGGAKGIGAAIATRLARDGFRVVVADRISDAAAPPDGRVVTCDVGDEAAVARLVQDISGTEQRLDALICNAGLMIRKPIRELTLSEWSSVLATNLTSTFLLMRGFETLLRTARGTVVTIASTRARMSEPHTESYAASKGGLVALTRALAISLGPEVRVNCISPGWILTKGPAPDAGRARIPSGRPGWHGGGHRRADRLVGPESGFITGTEFVIDGGVTRKMIYPE